MIFRTSFLNKASFNSVQRLFKIVAPISRFFFVKLVLNIGLGNMYGFVTMSYIEN
jgi:hypothetical protein